MVDLFALGLAHALMALAAWRLVLRGDLDHDPAPAPPQAANEGRAADEGKAGDRRRG